MVMRIVASVSTVDLVCLSPLNLCLVSDYTFFCENEDEMSSKCIWTEIWSFRHTNPDRKNCQHRQGEIITTSFDSFENPFHSSIPVWNPPQPIYSRPNGYTYVVKKLWSNFLDICMPLEIGFESSPHINSGIRICKQILKCRNCATKFVILVRSILPCFTCPVFSFVISRMGTIWF